MTTNVERDAQIVIIGAGVFGLSTALQLCQEGFLNVTVLDRSMPPVPDGSSVDISRIIRFDYGDKIYAKLAKEAYDRWASCPLYKPSFFPSPFILASSTASGGSYINQCVDSLRELEQPYERITKTMVTQYGLPALARQFENPRFEGYCNERAGWADAALAISSLRDRCVKAGVSFITGSRGTVTGFQIDHGGNRIVSTQVQSGDDIKGDLFVLAAGAWSSRLVPMYNTTLATAQVLGFMKLTEPEMIRYRNLPIYINFSTGFFSFPPHPDGNYLKVAVHGWGYTRTESRTSRCEQASLEVSAPPSKPVSSRKNFAPQDGIERLKDGMEEILPELASRDFERVGVCWYTDTPTGDFIIDYHPKYGNLHLATGGSGHAFKFLPVLGEYIVCSIKRELPEELHHKWRFRSEYQDAPDVFRGDGSRGGPSRRELSPQEKAKL